MAYLLTNDAETLLVVKDGEQNSVYALEGSREYGMNFYGFRPFLASLTQDAPLADQPYGKIGQASDLTGRMMTRSTGKGNISGSGGSIDRLEVPEYSLKGSFSDSELEKELAGYRPVEKDVPYAAITTWSNAGCDTGEDRYIKTLFLTTGGYGLVATSTAAAGRDLDDCCSHEFHYELEKVELGDTSPLVSYKENEAASEATIWDWGVKGEPLDRTTTVDKDDGAEKRAGVDSLIEELYQSLRPEK